MFMYNVNAALFVYCNIVLYNKKFGKIMGVLLFVSYKTIIEISIPDIIPFLSPVSWKQ